MPLLDYNIISYPTATLGASINKKRTLNVYKYRFDVYCKSILIQILFCTQRVHCRVVLCIVFIKHQIIRAVSSKLFKLLGRDHTMIALEPIIKTNNKQ